ncbi:hypothetical protein SAQ01S_08830 [Sphingomonas aquatilis NBRC 16722]|uniref:Uncharacterized protein n=1 Tax=Sphingomonas aquatilis TaxID=93063 RepID=A0AAW3TRU1_9SPHN|nr:hypothetical protein [Sphingomonas aquatilis]MBB3874840.1 hypothetical protein [Sphingomonas aquatilis]GEM71117.1 hypothetical protein SAQ01S_08830 [Sphingomonas aquatilis NBRC 16722]
MTAKPKLTKTERIIRQCMMSNASNEIVYRQQRYWESVEQGLSKSIQDRRHREFMKACEGLIEVGTCRLPDAYLRSVYGEKAVIERDKLLGAGGGVVPLKRNGRPLR